jgi:RND family efflux transporter MFP subunit
LPVAAPDGGKANTAQPADGKGTATPPGKGEHQFLRQSILVALILIAGFVAMRVLSSMAAPPALADIPERVLTVRTVVVQPENETVVMEGLGPARAINTVAIMPEVPGNVIEVHPRLENGELIPAGELLFRIDPRNYEAALQQARAQRDQAQSTLARLKVMYNIDRDRLATMERSRNLAKGEFDRISTLLKRDQVGTQSAADQAEMAYNTMLENYNRLAQAVETYPNQIREAEAMLAAAEAALQLAQTNLERTEIRAPFNARLKMVQVEQGQYVAPGAPVLMLADDSTIEISVPIDSRDAREWLRFKDGQPPDGLAWFPEVEPVSCTVRWTENPDEQLWQGTLHRIERFDQQTRTVTLAIRVPAAEAAARPGRLPLVEGMFCRVEIPGRTMQDVYRLPRWAVTFEGKTHLAQDMRLQVRDVEVVRSQGDDVFVRGLQPGDQVIVTRLSNPVPNTRLELSNEAEATEEPAAI